MFGKALNNPPRVNLEYPAGPLAESRECKVGVSTISIRRNLTSEEGMFEHSSHTILKFSKPFYYKGIQVIKCNASDTPLKLQYKTPLDFYTRV